MAERAATGMRPLRLNMEADDSGGGAQVKASREGDVGDVRDVLVVV